MKTFMISAILLLQISLALSQCTWRHTRATIDGGGKVVFLDRHNVQCGRNQAIRSFQLHRAGNNHIFYRYRCCLVKGGCRKEYRATRFDKDKNTLYLARHHPKCDSGKGYMAAFRLVRNKTKHMIKYRYTCCNVRKPTKQICYNASTCFNNDGNGNLRYLVRHNVACSAGFYIAEFKLARNAHHNKYRYNYKCCTSAKA